MDFKQHDPGLLVPHAEAVGTCLVVWWWWCGAGVVVVLVLVWWWWWRWWWSVQAFRCAFLQEDPLMDDAKFIRSLATSGKVGR